MAEIGEPPADRAEDHDSQHPPEDQHGNGERSGHQRQRFEPPAGIGLDMEHEAPGKQARGHVRGSNSRRDVFGATSELLQQREGFHLTMVKVGPTAELNVFELAGNTESQRRTPMFRRGRLDHLALEAASLDAFDEIRQRLLARGATDGFVTDFGHILSLFFRDPDGLEAEICVVNPDAQPGVHHPPGTPSQRYHQPDAPPPERLRDSPLRQ